MQERQTELAERVARVRHKAHPWRSLIALALAIAAAVISDRTRRGTYMFSASALTEQAIRYSAAAAFGIFGSVATFGLASQVRGVLEPRAGTAHAAVFRYAVLIIGEFTTLVITLDLFGIPVTQLVLGGALTSVFVGIAAQQALGNVFAGLVLLIAKPFVVGEDILVRSGALGGPITGRVVNLTLVHVVLETDDGPLLLPNAGVLAAAIGPVKPRGG